MDLAEAIARVTDDPEEPSDRELGQIIAAVTAGIVRCAAAIAAGSAWHTDGTGDVDEHVVLSAKRFERYILTGE